MKIGDKVKGKVTGIRSYGAFVELSNKEIGLIHISEVRAGFVENIHDFLEVGQEIFVQIVDIDQYTGKVSLSLRALEEDKQSVMRHHRFSNDRYQIGFEPFRRNMKTWIKESLNDLGIKK
ncbi:CvfD/Ygs/GSP13 family RNA-binding post-transcriptional regulator [Streptococcus massiliensis]|uniref:S1 RNA binding domain-containing protein n=1 Tax=Streptococcus massiliensis TaxID=313439 RepID=A0A380KXG4_9STRE|nr:CvfD/Ygs/GSP13 family RNA-binding post-transcriptional regulator [Streptococcus massiliensis]SUN76643.1 S1 RNA binding domain-containing protein [Streptococcus massiliensis]